MLSFLLGELSVFCVTSLGSLLLVSPGLVPMCFYFCLFCFVNFIVINHICECNNLLIPVSLSKSLNLGVVLETGTHGFRYKCKGHSLPSEIHTLDKMFNMLVFNYNSVS